MATHERPAILSPERSAATLKARPWGGAHLSAVARAMGLPAEDPIGESWELSTMEGSESRALGRPLSQVLGAPLPFLVKILDTGRPLSLQVHPGEGDRRWPDGAKEEAWVILHADPGASIAVGLRPGARTQDLADALTHAERTGDSGPLFACLHAIPARRGTCIVVPAGTPHAIGGGILLAEIQQPSDVTLRLYDYGSERALHVQDGLSVIDAGSDFDASRHVWQADAQAHAATPPVLEGRLVWLAPRLVGDSVAGQAVGPCAPPGSLATDSVFVAVDACTVHDRSRGEDRRYVLAEGAVALVDARARGEVAIEAPRGSLVVEAGLRRHGG